MGAELSSIYPFATDEEAILGMAMYDGKARAAMLASLNEEHFRVPDHKRVFKLIQGLHSRGMACDPVTLLSADQRRDLAPLLADLDCKRPLTLQPDVFINALLEREWRSRFLNEAGRVVSVAERSPEALSIDSLNDTFRARPMATGLGVENPDLANIAADDLETRMVDYAEGRRSYISTGWGQLDALIHGFRYGSFTVLAGRPGAGKTSLGLHFALNALFKGVPTLYCTWEMTERELVRKMLSSLGRIPISKLMDGTVSDEEANRYIKAKHDFERLPFVVFQSLPDLDAVCAEVRRYAIRSNAKLAFVDYLGLVPTKTQHKTPRERMIEVTRRMKLLANELEIPIVGLAQLRRPPTKNQNLPPSRDDLKESGSLEEDADNVLLIWRKHDEQTNKFTNTMIVDKARHGTEGRVLFNANFAINSFAEII